MRTILFIIPHELADIPVFGFGWALMLWVALSLLTLAVLIRRQGWNKDTASYLPLQILVAVMIAFFLPRLEALTPEGVPLGVPVRGFGVMMAAAMVAGVGMALYRAQQMGLDPDVIYSLAMWMGLPGLIGARVFHIVQYWDEFAKPTVQETIFAMLNFTSGGLVMYGSVLAGVPFGIYYLVRHKLPVLAIGDIIAPSMVVGLAIGRVGCFLNGCCYGGLCDGPQGVTFPPGSPPFQRHQEVGWLYGLRLSRHEQGVVIDRVLPGSAADRAGVRAGEHVMTIRGRDVDSLGQAYALLSKSGRDLSLTTAEGRNYAIGTPSRSLPVHPAQLYAALDALFLAAFLWLYFPFRIRDGEVFALLLTLHPISRFLLELIRDDELGQFGTALTISQWLSLAILLAAVGLWWYVLRQPRGRALPHERSLGVSAAAA